MTDPSAYSGYGAGGFAGPGLEGYGACAGGGCGEPSRAEDSYRFLFPRLSYSNTPEAMAYIRGAGPDDLPVMFNPSKIESVIRGREQQYVSGCASYFAPPEVLYGGDELLPNLNGRAAMYTLPEISGFVPSGAPGSVFDSYRPDPLAGIPTRMTEVSFAPVSLNDLEYQADKARAGRIWEAGRRKRIEAQARLGAIYGRFAESPFASLAATTDPSF